MDIESSPGCDAIWRAKPRTANCGHPFELQGALAGLGSLTSIVSPPLLTNLFSYFTSTSAPVYFPGAAFLAAALFLLLAALAFARTRHQPVPDAAE